jgi:cation:H+ antiporter
MWIQAITFLVSLIVLIYAADVFVRCVVLTANLLRIPPMVIGLSVVAVGTSLPELASSVVAALNNHPEIALGNVIGSNICNVALILAIPAFIAPVVCARKTVVREGYLMIGLSLVTWCVGLVGMSFLREIGVLFLLGFVVFLIWVFKSKDVQLDEQVSGEVSTESSKRLTLNVIKLIFSIAIIWISSEFLVKSAVQLANWLGVSESIIALSLIALGTSLPELSVSIAAVRRKEGDILVGNIVGSNISNILLVLGASAVIHPIQTSWELVYLDMPMMIVTSLAMIIFLLQKSGITRIKGVFLLSLYAIFIWRFFAFSL